METYTNLHLGQYAASLSPETAYSYQDSIDLLDIC